MSGKLDALIGILTRRFASAPSPAGARTSRQNEAGLESEAALASASPLRAMAIVESYSRHLPVELLLLGEGQASEEPRGPEYLPMLWRRARAHSGNLEDGDNAQGDRGRRG
jgi:hypothetical protein